MRYKLCRFRSPDCDRRSAYTQWLPRNAPRPRGLKAVFVVDGGVWSRSYMRNTPYLCGSIGALSDAEIANPNTRRVSAGSMMPSSHRRALA